MHWIVPSSSSKREVEGFSYTEYPLPPKFGGGGSSTTFTKPSLFFWGWRGGARRQRVRRWRAYCILSAVREEPHPPEALLECPAPKKRSTVFFGGRAGTLHLQNFWREEQGGVMFGGGGSSTTFTKPSVFFEGGAGRSNVWRWRVQYPPPPPELR